MWEAVRGIKICVCVSLIFIFIISSELHPELGETCYFFHVFIIIIF